MKDCYWSAQMFYGVAPYGISLVKREKEEMCQSMVQYGHSLWVDLWVGIGVRICLACTFQGGTRYSLHSKARRSTTRCCCSWHYSSHKRAMIRCVVPCTAEKEFFLPSFRMKNEE